MASVATSSIADAMRPFIAAVLGTPDPPVPFEFWDGSTLGRSHGTSTRIVIRSPTALRRVLYAPNELGFGRAYVSGDIDIDGDVYEALALRDQLAAPDEHADLRVGWRGRIAALRVARAVGALGPPLPPPDEEVRLRGRRHSQARDAAAVAHHYDVGNDFYRLVLGSSMAYSCAYFTHEGATLEEAQHAKFDLVARKLALAPGMRLLDVGCGWGGMVIHAAREYGVDAVGITVSREQADLARKRAVEAGVAAHVEIRVQDYRDVDDGPFDAVSSIGMFEHVGLAQMEQYVAKLVSLVRPLGRVLNHGISRPPGPAAFDRNSFIERYVFPDGEIHEVGTVVSVLQGAGLEVRDVHSLREHYARTLRCWVRNLEANWDEAIELVGAPRARVWRLYMAGSAVNFEQARTSIHQVLAVKPGAAGESGFEATRAAYAV